MILVPKTEKACKGCNIIKPISEFYKKKGIPNRRAHCIKCYLAMNRRWCEMNPEKRAASSKAYKNTPAGKLSERLYRERNHKKNKPKRYARRAAYWAVETGKMRKLPCRVCGLTPTEMHHSDYSKPLSVTWLCRKHHTQLHKEQRKQLCS